MPKVKKSPKSPKSKDKKKPSEKGLIYLDNAATTFIYPPAAEEFKKWLSCPNPSTDSKIANPARCVIQKARDYIYKLCNITPLQYTILFTSGASESNCLILRSSVEAYKRMRGIIPHIITSELEHSSILRCVADMEKCGLIQLNLVKPNIYGVVLPETVEKVIKDNTALISIMAANNEIGSINNIHAIAKISHKHSIPFHSDATQYFPKVNLDVKKFGLDAISTSAHKHYGPKGIGLLILNNNFIKGYDLKAQVSGHQQPKELRGGTLNPAAIASSIVAMKWNFQNRTNKNKYLLSMRNFILDELEKHYAIGNYLNYINSGSLVEPHERVEIVILGPPRSNTSFYLPHIILLSIAKNKGKKFCNVDFKHLLDKQNVVIGIGSACLTSSYSASHVLDAISAPDVIKRGVLRISLGDYNTMSEIKHFCKIFVETLNKVLNDK